MTTQSEHAETFPCFGTTCTVVVTGPAAEAATAARAAREQLLQWHDQFSRFAPDSELSRVNGDPRATVEVSPMMAELAAAVSAAAMLTGGLADATLLSEIERAGYAQSLDGAPLLDGSRPPSVEGAPSPEGPRSLSLVEALALAPPRVPAGPSPRAAWRELRADLRAGTITRPPGLAIDSGGIAKGLFADAIADRLAGFPAFAVDCGGDVRLGGAGGIVREVRVESPLDGTVVDTRSLSGGAVATSGIGRRRWLGPDGRPAHHLLDPATGRPAFTGIVQATVFASTCVLAEALAKAALLSGPDGAERWMRLGGVLVLDDFSVRIVQPA